MRIQISLTILTLLCSASTSAAADKPHATATLIADASTVAPGESVTIGLRFRIDPHWHIYWLNPGDSGMATTFDLTAPDGCDVGPIQWPAPRKFSDGTFTTYGYENDVVLMRTVRIPKNAKPGTTLTFKANSEWLVCDKEACVAGDAKLQLSLAFGNKREQANAAVFDAARKQLPASGDDAPGKFTFVLGPNASQPAGKATLTRFNLVWSEKATAVDWYPAATDAMLVEDLKVETTGQFTKISYKLTSLDPDAEQIEIVPGVLVFTDKNGVRHARVWNGLGQPIRKTTP